MDQQGYLTHAIYESEKAEPLPTRDDLTFPKEDTDYPYFTSWIKQQVVDQLGGGQQGAQLAFEGGLKVKTTIDSRLQTAAQKAIDAWLPNKSGPRASLVAISNKDGAVRAMFGGDNYGTAPFNLATQGQRQPGSSFKPFVLAEALKQGISPNSTWESKKLTYILKGGERFTVNNYDDAYAGVTTLANATAFSDNAVFVQVGKKVGTKKVSKLARRMGVRTPVSTNLAIALGGLRTGVTPLDMAHAYETFATGGKLIYGSLSPGQSKKSLPVPGPVGIERIDRVRGKKTKLVELPDGERMINKIKKRTVLKPEIANEVGVLLQGVVKKGSATRAQIPGVMIAGKTGTTENYGDAWFVGWTKEYTVAVWVGYPDEFKPMKTEFQGEPVAGGTFPAGIWKTFMESLLKYDPLPKKDGGDGTGKDLEPTPTPSGDGSGTVPPTATTAPPAATTAPPATDNGGAGTGGTGGTGGTVGRAAISRPRPRRTPRRRRTRHRRRTPRRPPTRERRTPAAARQGVAVRPRRLPGATPRPAPARPAPAESSAKRSPKPRSNAQPAASTKRLGAAGHPRSRVQPGGQGRETSREPIAQKRHGSSAALVIPIRGPVTYGRRAREDPDRAVDQRRVVLGQLDPQRLRQLARAVGQRRRAAALAHHPDPLERLQRTDQHRRAHALGLTDRVHQRVDAVGAVHVGRARAVRSSTRGARRQADVRVARRLGEVVRLGLDDHARASRRARRRTRAGRARRPAPGGRRTTTSRTSRPATPSAWASCSRTRASDVPPSLSLDSSHDP